MDIGKLGEQESAIEDFLKNGMLLYDMGLYAELTQLCQEFLADTPDGRVYSMLSSAEFALGDFESAEKNARKGLLINPGNPDLLYNLACLLENKGLLSNALRYYVRAKEAGDEELSGICHDNIARIEDVLVKSVNEIIPTKAQKRALVIAAIYPPRSGSGVQRTVKLVKYLRFFGWEPIVITPAVDSKPRFLGNDYFDELPDDIEVTHTPIDTDFTPSDLEYMKGKLESMLSPETRTQFSQTYNNFGFKQRIALCGFPEAAVLWAYRTADNIAEHVDINTIDVIYSTSGPYSDHFAAYHIKKQHHIPWVADFRDEWSNCPAIWPNKNDLSYQLCIDCEQAILKFADHVICVTERSFDNYLSLGLTEDRLSCITNGYDEEDFEGLFDKSASNEKFTVTHNGILYFDRTPYKMLEALRNLICRKEIDGDKIVVHFGNIPDESDRAKFEGQVRQMGLEQIAVCTPYMEHRESLCHAASSNLLLAALGESADYAATYVGKVFEYLRLKKPILCLSPCSSIMEYLLNRTGHGTNVECADIEGIEKELLRHYNAWLEQSSLGVASLSDITVYERKNLTCRHAEVFDSISNC